jgi:chromosome segregation ATPase
MTEESATQWLDNVNAGIEAFARFLVTEYHVEYPALGKLRRRALEFYFGDDDGEGTLSLLEESTGLKSLKTALAAAEKRAMDAAAAKLEKLEREHAAYTKRWVVQPTEQMQAVMRRQIEELEGQIEHWTAMKEPVSKRLGRLDTEGKKLVDEQERLLRELPSLDAREKGEALRRVIESVTLFWDRRHCPKRAESSRQRKTNRDGRFRFVVNHAKTAWAFRDTELRDTR